MYRIIVDYPIRPHNYIIRRFQSHKHSIETTSFSTEIVGGLS